MGTIWEAEARDGERGFPRRVHVLAGDHAEARARAARRLGFFDAFDPRFITFAVEAGASEACPSPRPSPNF